eukprot:428862_1
MCSQRYYYVHKKRAHSRNRHFEEGLKQYQEGNRGQAASHFAKAVDITPQMAFEVILKLKQMNVEYYVSPYEADAQLAYLYKIGHISAVISIDSDLLPFGCERLLTKYSNGRAKEVNLTRIKQNINPLDFSQFTFEMFQQFCVLCGCDYLPSIPGIGPKTAHRLMLKCKDWEIVISCIKSKGKHRVPVNYKDAFKQALYIFRHQSVYDPKHKRMVHLQPLSFDQEDMAAGKDFLGPSMDASLVQHIALGQIDPITKHPFLAQTQTLSYVSRSLSSCNVNKSVHNHMDDDYGQAIKQTQNMNEMNKANPMEMKEPS